MKQFLLATIFLTIFTAKPEYVQAMQEIPPRPLDESCEPLDLMDKLNLKFDSKKFWKAKLRELEKYSSALEGFLRIAPLEMEREIQNELMDIRRERLLNPDLYQGQVGQMLLEMEASNVEATRDMWVVIIESTQESLRWSAKCRQQVKHLL